VSRARRTLPRWAVGVVAVVGLGVGLSACSNDGASAARQACGHVERSLALYRQSTQASNPARSHALADQAYIQLRAALPLTWQAASQNALWQALLTTVSESNRVPESHLVTSLKAQCAVAFRAQHGQPPPPTSVPPPATTPPGS
jgi:hypothetical protein